MGEALMPRRGGGSFKRGVIANVSEFAMSDPALVGVKNAIIWLTSSLYAANDTVVCISIANGEISSVSTINEYSVYYGYIVAPSLLSINTAIGQITSDVNVIGNALRFGGYSSVGGEQVGRYNYIIFD